MWHGFGPAVTDCAALSRVLSLGTAVHSWNIPAVHMPRWGMHRIPVLLRERGDWNSMFFMGRFVVNCHVNLYSAE